MKKIVIIILSLVMLLSPAMPLHAEDWTPPTEEDCDALLEAAEKLGSDRTQAENAKLRLSLEIIDKEKEADKAENEKRECEKDLELCLLTKDRKIELIEEKVSELEQELAGDKEDVANLESERNGVESEIQQWAADHGLLGVFGGQAIQVAAGGIGSLIVAKVMAKMVLLPIGLAADALGIILLTADRLHFEDLVRRADKAKERLYDAHMKERETGEALDRWKEQLSKEKAEREAACPDERKRLEEAEKQYNKVQGELDELRQQLEEQRRKIDELNRKIPEAWADWEECRNSMLFTYDLTVTASEGGRVTLSSKRGTYQVSAGRTGKGPVTQGTEVTLTALSGVGYFFEEWSSFEITSGAAAARMTGNTVVITMRTDIDVYARFEPLAVAIPKMTGPPAITPGAITGNGENVKVTVPVTTDAKTVAIRLIDPATGTIAVMAFADNPSAKSVVEIETPPVRAYPPQLYLKVIVYGAADSIYSRYTCDPSIASTYILEQDDGAGNTYSTVTAISVTWLTILD